MLSTFHIFICHLFIFPTFLTLSDIFFIKRFLLLYHILFSPLWLNSEKYRLLILRWQIFSNRDRYSRLMTKIGRVQWVDYCLILIKKPLISGKGSEVGSLDPYISSGCCCMNFVCLYQSTKWCAKQHSTANHTLSRVQQHNKCVNMCESVV